jgi:hypothetical protein
MRMFNVLLMVCALFFASFAFASDVTEVVPESEPAVEAPTEDVAPSESAPDEVPVEDTEGEPETAPVAEPEVVEDVSVVPPVQGELETDAEALSAVGELVGAVMRGEWMLAFALLVMLVVFVLRKFGVLGRVSTRALPFVSASVGLLVGFAAAALAGAALLPALFAGVASGLAASGLWDLLAG